jgi:serine/threonine-protein kinase
VTDSSAGTERPLPPGYDLVRELGAGGCGVVYLAEQTALKRLVALKRIHGYALVQGEGLDRFRREAQVLASMEHPAVVRVFDFRRSEHDATLVMEYVAGESLADRLERGPLPVAESLVVLRDVAAALHAASERGIAHRDIKPGNVFLLADGHAKLGDFGLARIVSDPSVFRTSTGEVSGTPAYFPPECGDASHEPDERSDAYSFAVMAYEMLTGQLPFTGTDLMQIVAAHFSQPPPPPETVLPGFPQAASTALLAGLEKDPARRLLPWDLVDRLAAVPGNAWPAIPASAGSAAPRKVAAYEPTVRGIVTPPGATASTPATAPPSRRPSRRRIGPRTLVTAGAVAVLAVAAIIAFTSGGGSDSTATDLRVQSVDVSVTPRGGSGSCPNALFVFSADLTTNGGAGHVTLRWVRPDGQRSDPVDVPVNAGQEHATAELRFQVTGDQPLSGRATARVLAPDAVSGKSRPISYTC